MTRFLMVLQSQACHPDWTAHDHALYLESEHPDGMRGLDEAQIGAWLAENIGTGRLRSVLAQAVRA